MIQRLQVKRNEKGFTLIELLIVIIVLGILAAIVVFAVGSTRKDSVQASCRTTYKSAELSAESVVTKTGAAPTVIADLWTPIKGGLLKSALPTTGDYVMTYSAGTGTSYTLAVGGTKVVGNGTGTGQVAAVADTDNSVTGCVGT